MFLSLLLGVLLARAEIKSPQAEPWRHCKSDTAEKLLADGMSLQSELESERALALYKECLKVEPGCGACHYEMGWSYWKLGDWAEVVRSWEEALKLVPDHPDIPQYMGAAKENLALVKVHQIPKSFVSGISIGTHSLPQEAPVSMLLLSRRQSYNRQPAQPMDLYDPDIQSPKSVHFSRDGKKVYVNSLEGGKTIIYDTLGLSKTKVISHRFTAKEAPLFMGKIPWGYAFPKGIKSPNEFLGKPVEIEDTHGGRFLWVPYYRRSYDENGTSPSALALIDTQTDAIVRVMHVGPISKYVKASNTGRWLAVSHWGDNTVGLIDIRGNDFHRFRQESLLVVEEKMDTRNVKGDRDRNCGFCVRGLVFSGDDRYLFVSRMKGGGIAVFRLDPDAAGHSHYLGTVFGLVPGPRDLEISGDQLFVSCNASGVVLRVPWKKLVEALEALDPALPPKKRVLRLTVKKEDGKKAYVGLGARSLRLSASGNYLFVSVNQTSELVAIDTRSMQIVARIPVDSFPVGLDRSPDDMQVWVTSQGHAAKGGNSVNVFQVRYKTEEIIPAEPPAATSIR